ncbi:MAG: hypothetical protein ACRD2U_06550 [Terriglobales bacterium]
MLHKCANSACLNLFRSMSRGKLFHVATDTRLRLGARTLRKQRAKSSLEYFWLCDDCSPNFTLAFAAENQKGMIAVPLSGEIKKQMTSRARARQHDLPSKGAPCTSS